MQRRDFLNSALGMTAGMAAVRTNADEVPGESTGEESSGVERLTERLRPAVQHAREVALGILKPTPKQLEHGLRLHAESIVFDSYGFSPRAAIDGDAFAKEVEAGASDLELQDLREEMTMTRYVTDTAEQQEYLDAWRVSGVTCIFQNAGEEGQDPLRLIKRLARFTFATDMLDEYVVKAGTPEHIREAKRLGKHALYFTGNGVPLTQQWVSVPDELRYLRVFYQLGIRMMHLTYQRRNMIGDGCGETANAGLSDFGRSVVAEMNRVGVIPDCAHSGWQTSLEAAKLSSKPCVASHTVCAALDSKPHARSKPDEVIKAIVDSGGFVGICCIPRYLKGTGDIAMLLNHVDYIAQKFGVDHVAIGTDVAYNSSNSSAESKKVPRRPRRREDFRMLWPDDDFKTTSTMTNSIAWTNWPLFTVGLVQRGYSDEDIRKILGENVLRVAEETMKA
ncbi:dipeptidase [Rubinisphaera margarita]|uniref:dipeptidase n=1 Tax=Rubinisphaera margarita TaxID=2909586 RepID=UPI001EE7F923|nr:membrane dipeptidase [Rubinisphaera margarita]MCG6155584.1 dipeptidase [Rubinisphaera margarita]